MRFLVEDQKPKYYKSHISRNKIENKIDITL